MKLIVKWLCSAAALLAVAYLYSGVTVTSFPAALLAAAVLGALNTVVRPVLVLLTLPVTLVTLGLFLFVINALMFWAAASLLSGLHVTRQDVKYLSCTRCRVESAEDPAPFEIEGEVLGHTPVEFSVVPYGIRVIAP